MSPALMKQLIESEYCWHLTYYPSLEPDPECPEFTPADHFNVTVITSYDDQIDGWGSTADDAARDALNKLTLH